MLHLVVADVERADDLALRDERRAHDARELQRDDALARAEDVSASASETMTGRPVSRTRRTMLSETPPGRSVIASRFTLRDARTRAFRSARALPSARGLVEQEDALVGAGDVDDGVEHRLEQLVEVPQCHQLFAELVELADPGELGRRAVADGGTVAAVVVRARRSARRTC